MLSRINIQHQLIQGKEKIESWRKKKKKERDGGMEAALRALLLREEADYLKTD